MIKTWLSLGFFLFLTPSIGAAEFSKIDAAKYDSKPFESALGGSGVQILFRSQFRKVETSADFVAQVKAYESVFGSLGTYTVYEYQYEFINQSDSDVLINLASSDLSLSPFNQILQGFQIKIPANNKWVMIYQASQAPGLAEGVLNIEIWGKGIVSPTIQWNFAMSGGVTFVSPVWDSPFVVIKNSLVPK